MGIDNHPPRKSSIGDLMDSDRLNIHRQGNEGSFLDFISGRGNGRKVFFTIEEKRALILNGEEPLDSSLGMEFSKKGYQEALAQRERARKYIEEMEKNKQNTDEVDEMSE